MSAAEVNAGVLNVSDLEKRCELRIDEPSRLKDVDLGEDK